MMTLAMQRTICNVWDAVRAYRRGRVTREQAVRIINSIDASVQTRAEAMTAMR